MAYMLRWILFPSPALLHTASALKNEDLSYVDMYSFKGYCYFDNSSDIKTYFQDHLTFKDNTALAGSTLFGGAIDTTDSNIGIVQIHPYYSIGASAALERQPPPHRFVKSRLSLQPDKPSP